MTDNVQSLSKNIESGVENRLKDLHTAMPGIIKEFDPATQLAKVQPAIKRVFKTLDGDIEILVPESLPILINVPVWFPRGGGFSFTMPIAVDDECLLIFNERAIDNWHEYGGVRKPTAKRFHSLSDAIALVGFSSKPNKIPNFNADDCELKKDDGSLIVRLKSDGSSIDITAPDININGNLTVTGVVNAPTIEADDSLTVSGVEVKQHSHTQGNDSSGDTQVPTSPMV